MRCIERYPDELHDPRSNDDLDKLEDNFTEKKKVRLPKVHGAKEKRYIP